MTVLEEAQRAGTGDDAAPAVLPTVEFDTGPDRYRHWKLVTDSEVATVTLMVDEETVQLRHHLASSDEERAETADLLKAGFEESGLPRRKLLMSSMVLDACSWIWVPWVLRRSAVPAIIADVVVLIA